LDTARLTPPFTQFRLWQVPSLANAGEHAADAVAWLLKHRSKQAMVDALREAWGSLNLPLRDWAHRISEIGVWVRNGDVRLGVRLTERRAIAVWQAVPISQARLRSLTKSFPHAPPKVMEDLALAAPGLSLNDTGALAEPQFFGNRLGYVTDWVKGVKTELAEVARLGFEYPDPRRHLMEVASNGLGDCYVLGVDECVYFFDHEVPGLVRCSVGLGQLVERYFDRPHDILDPYVAGWAEHPCETPRTIPSPDPPSVVLSERRMQLSGLASIALAVRGCQRAMPDEWLRSVPNEWRSFEEDLRQIIERCKEVAVTGKPLSKRVTKEARRRANTVTRDWKRLDDAERTGYRFDSLTYFAIPALAMACHAVGDAQAIEETAWCDAIATRVAPDDTSARAAIVDADYLLSLGLGAPSTVGRPVPAEFFSRPLWPEGTRKLR
jgi:hypothetical protein